MPFCNKTVTFYDHPEKERILNWLESGTLTQLAKQTPCSESGISALKQEIKSGKKLPYRNFSVSFEKFVLIAVREFEKKEEEKQASKIPSILKNEDNGNSLPQPFLSTPTDKKGLLCEMIKEKIESFDYDKLKNIYAYLIRTELSVHC